MDKMVEIGEMVEMGVFCHPERAQRAEGSLRCFDYANASLSMTENNLANLTNLNKIVVQDINFKY